MMEPFKELFEMNLSINQDDSPQKQAEKLIKNKDPDENQVNDENCPPNITVRSKNNADAEDSFLSLRYEQSDTGDFNDLLQLSFDKDLLSKSVLCPPVMTILKTNETQSKEFPRCRDSLLHDFDPLNSPGDTKLDIGSFLNSTLTLVEELTSSSQSEYVSVTSEEEIDERIDADCKFVVNQVIDKVGEILEVGFSQEDTVLTINEAKLEDKSATNDVADQLIINVVEELVNSIVEKASFLGEHYIYSKNLQEKVAQDMSDISDKLAFQEDESADLRLQLNASQQVRAALELQLRQKEELIIKSNSQLSKRDQEIKQLTERLEESIAKSDSSDLQKTIRTLQAREAKLLLELNTLKESEQNYRKVMNDYEKTISSKLAELQKLMGEHETANRHLANLELAFSDVHQKYERSKKIIDGYKSNEETLRETLTSSEETLIKSEEKYESLKAHARAQIEKSNEELMLMREKFEAEVSKQNAIIRRLEIKNESLSQSLEQKIKECSALTALCDEVTGKV